VLVVESVNGDTIALESVTRLASDTGLDELRVILIVPTVEVSDDIRVTLVDVVVVVVGFGVVELGVLETSTGRDLTRLVLLYGTMPLDTTCATLFAIRIAVATFICRTPSFEFLLLTNVHDPFWNVKPEQLLVFEHISEQDARSLVAKLEVILLLAGKNVLQRIS